MGFDLMFVAAHPDDAEIGAGGTIATLAAAGARIAIVDLSDGEPTPHGSPAIRAAEAAEAARILGVKKRVQLDLVNREILDDVPARKKLAAVIRELQPRLLFAPYPEDAHPDHPEASRIAVAARFYSKFVKTDLPHAPHYPEKIFFYFSIHMRVKCQPSFVFDVSERIDQKMLALRAYKSQFVQHAGNAALLDRIRNENAYWGAQVRAAFGEPFHCAEHIRLDSLSSLLSA